MSSPAAIDESSTAVLFRRGRVGLIDGICAAIGGNPCRHGDETAQHGISAAQSRRKAFSGDTHREEHTVKITASRSMAVIGLLVAAVGTSATAESASGTAPVAVSSDGLKVVRDKASGRLRAPTAAELKDLSDHEPAPAAPAAVEVVDHANGMRSARLPSEMLISVEARRDADGVLRTRHDRPGMDHGGSTMLPTE